MLSGKDILSFLDVLILRYRDLQYIPDIDDLIEKKPVVILYPTNVEGNVGHWTCIWLYGNKLRFFDSYSHFPDTELDWSPKRIYAYLSNLLLNSKYDSEYNDYKLQGKKSTVCGNWVVARLSLPQLNDKQFYKLFEPERNLTSDQLVVAYTNTLPRINIYGSGVIPKDDGIYLLLSQEAYRPKNERKELIDGYIYDKDLSSERTAVYVKDGSTIISHRGTVPTDVSDLKQDALILTGDFHKSDRLKKSLSQVETAMKKYPKNIISNTGHSLGGRVASEIGRLLPVRDSKVVAFNIGSSPRDVTKNVYESTKCKLSNDDLCKKLKNQTLYTTGVDPISINSLSQIGSKVSKPTTANVHSLKNFSF
jgi:hypothetical protein